ncbi:MAG TPA: PLP-dependent aminotransferase family protein [Ramlibacter sp.]|nr:PLP-dependent aminotransferase family protein [Ramlibacter sp.]
MESAVPPAPLYRQLASHYAGAISAGTLRSGDRLPSLRGLVQLHKVSLSTALQVCRSLEDQGYVEARERSGYYVRRTRDVRPGRMEDRPAPQPLDPAQYVGIHAQVSSFVARGRQSPVNVNLSVARAAPQHYPVEPLRKAVARALREKPLLLGSAAPQNGNRGFREVLAKRAVAGRMALSADEVLVTHGCIEALNLALRAITQPGDVVAVESPTFYGLLQVLESLGLQALEIPTSTRRGISLEALEFALDNSPGIKAVVVVPHLQNPTGAVMPDSRKEALVQLCAARGVPLIEDDTYTELMEADSPARSLKSWDAAGGVIHCASLHKMLAPGLRLGWMSAGRWHARVEMLKYSQSRNNEELAQIAAASFMGSPAYDRHLRRLRSLLAVQRQRVAEALIEHFPAGTRTTLPAGGLHLWVEVPGVSSARLFEAALAQRILVTPGTLFSNTGRFDSFLRLGCGWPYSDEIDAALKTLGRLAADLG